MLSAAAVQQQQQRWTTSREAHARKYSWEGVGGFFARLPGSVRDRRSTDDEPWRVSPMATSKEDGNTRIPTCVPFRQRRTNSFTPGKQASSEYIASGTAN